MSSRENPSVICVRSFVPNEKNSATSAIWLAVTAARGTSIIVPTMYSILSLRSEKTCSAVESMICFW